MVIHYMKEECLDALKLNIESNKRLYNNPTNEWVYEYFNGESPFLEYMHPIEDFQFARVEDFDGDISKCDTENTIRLYAAMSGLTESQAMDERLWAGLCHGDFWNFMQERWKTANSERVTADVIGSRYFLSRKDGIRRAIFRNTLSRFWWIGRLTVDERRKDPFELTRYWEVDYSTKALIIFSSNYTSNVSLLRGMISALMELEQEGYHTGRLYYRAGQYLNVFGGSHILDYYTEEEIKEKVKNHIINSRTA